MAVGICVLLLLCVEVGTVGERSVERYVSTGPNQDSDSCCEVFFVGVVAVSVCCGSGRVVCGEVFWETYVSRCRVSA